jgi:hypothetical protein
MSTKRLWVVTLAAEVAVLAESMADAEDEAREALRSGDVDPEPDRPSPMTWLPAGWDKSCIPYGADGDETIEDAIAAGAAPEYVEALAKLKQGAR